MRKLASIQTVTNTRPAPRLDNLVYVEVGGWQCLVPKNTYPDGSRVVFFEPDALLPTNYGCEFLTKDTSTGQKRWLVKETSIKGNHTAGLVLPLETVGVDGQPGDDLTKQLDIAKYVSPTELQAMSGGTIIGPYIPRWCPKSDATRIQNYHEHYQEITHLAWDVSVKCDGSSRTVVNDNGKLRYFTRNNEITPTKELTTLTPTRQLLELGDGYAIQMELLGPRIQRNRLQLAAPQALVFALWYRHQSIDRADWPDFPNTVKEITDWNWPEHYEDCFQQTAKLAGNYTKNCLDEGLVFCLKSHQQIPDWMVDQTRRLKILNQNYTQN